MVLCKLGPGKLGSSNWALVDWAPGKFGCGKVGPGKLGPGKLGPGKLGPWRIFVRQIRPLENCVQQIGILLIWRVYLCPSGTDGDSLQRWSIFDRDAMSMFCFITAMRCRWFKDILTIAIVAIIFVQPLGPIVFRWFFQFQNRCLGMIFVGNPRTTYITTCSNLRQIVRISVLWGKKEKHPQYHLKWTQTMDFQVFYNIFYWIVGYLPWAAIKADKLLLSSKTDGFQCHNHNRCDYFCSTIGINYFPMFFR